jgi:hypothetical protein
MEWKNHFQLPIHRVDTEKSFYWAARTENLNAWLEKRSVADPAKVTRSYLEEYELRKREVVGKQKRIREKLSGINQISQFSGHSIVTINDWFKYRDAPIKKENNQLVADADKLLSWLTEQNLVSLHIAAEKRQIWSAKR